MGSSLRSDENNAWKEGWEGESLREKVCIFLDFLSSCRNVHLVRCPSGEVAHGAAEDSCCFCVVCASPPSHLLPASCRFTKGAEIMEYLKLEGTFQNFSCPLKNALNSRFSYLTLSKKQLSRPLGFAPQTVCLLEFDLFRLFFFFF